MFPDLLSLLFLLIPSTGWLESFVSSFLPAFVQTSWRYSRELRTFFSSPSPPLQLIYFSDVGHSQDHPDQRTLRRFILSRTCGNTIPETAGTVHAKAASAEAIHGMWGKGQDQHPPARAQPLPLTTYLLICVFKIICEGAGCSACSVPQRGTCQWKS